MSESDYKRWVCDACGYIYDEAKGDPDSGLSPGTRYDEIPDDWMCPLCGLSKSDLRLLPEQPAAAVKPRTFSTSKKGKSKGGEDYVVIVGAGIAAWSVAEEIRKQDTSTPVLIVTACEGVSYPKPALSTAFAHGKSAEDLIDTDGQSKADELGIEIRTETRVIKIDPLKQRLTTVKGGIQYGKLILALGAHQRELPLTGDAADRVVRINDLAAYRKFRHQLEDHVRHVTILGAGLIGTEFAEDLVTGGYSVTVIDPASYPIPSLLPEQTARRLESTLSDKGVQWVFGKTVESVENSGDKVRAILNDGMAIETDIVLSAAGLVANTRLAEKMNIQVNRGIVVDHQMKTSVNNIYALGDCAEVDGNIHAYIEPIRRQATTIANSLRGDASSYEARSPLVRIKTPSFPLTVCLPANGNPNMISNVMDDEDRIEYLEGDKVIGFVLSNEQSRGANRLYQEIVG